MIRLFINGLAASAGAGLTYLRNVIPHLARRPDAQATVLLSADLRGEFAEFSNISYAEASPSGGVVGRFVFEQTKLRDLVRRSGAQVLVSTGNFALRDSPVPQILLSGNSLYVSADFYRDVRKRRDYMLWGDTWIKGWFARRSVRWADVTVAPSKAFAEDLSKWTGKNVLSVYHGFDRNLFTSDSTPLPDSMQKQLQESADALKLLFVSHYNYYRNFETLIRALVILRERLPGKKVKLILTCHLSSSKNPGWYRAETAASLMSILGVRDNIVELGSVPYHLLHHVYRACDIYVSPAYTETFAHPLVEAMSSGLPVVASDLRVHREICRDAAIYFPRFSSDGLAERVVQVHQSPGVAETLSQNGLTRAQDFRWDTHVERLLALAQELVRANPSDGTKMETKNRDEDREAVKRSESNGSER
ncbi:MAG TPA: glycosyltransferase family 1 protein [Terriglobales bacterium]|nr:glycosyltransferase family 1 protein [Terriglobales bacterium]